MNSYNRVYALLTETDFPTQKEIRTIHSGMTSKQIAVFNRTMTRTRKPGSKRGPWVSSDRAAKIAKRSR